MEQINTTPYQGDMNDEELSILYMLLSKFKDLYRESAESLDNSPLPPADEDDCYNQGNFENPELARDIGDMIWNR